MKWRGVERNARARAPFMVELRCIVDTVQGSKGEAGAAMGCPYGCGVAVDACGVVASSGGGGQWRSGGVRRPRAAVAHGPGRERPLCRGGGVLRGSGRVQGCQGSSGEVGCGVEARGRLGGLLHSGAQGGMATGASAPWPWRRRGKILPQWLALRGSNGCRGVREGVRR